MSYGNYPDLSSVKKILVIKLRHLGDVLLTSAVFSILKNRFPHALVDAYIYAEAKPMLEGDPAIDSCILYDRKWKNLPFFARMKNEWGVLQQIRKKNYDLVINLTEGDRGAIICRMSRSKICVGYDPEGKGLFWKKKIYSHVVKKCHSLKHTVERNLDALRVIGLFPEQDEKELKFIIPSEALIKMQDFLGKKGFEEKGFYLIHPTSRWRFKCWPVEKVRELIKMLLAEGKKIIITSGKDREEKEMIENIIRGISHNNLLDLSGQVSLKELGALIKLSLGLLCVDSVSFHIASALKANVVVLFGPTSDVTWGPWQNPNAKVLTQKFSCRPCYSDGCGGSKRSECLYTLPVIEVLAALKSCTA